MGRFIKWLIGDSVKAGLCYLGYRYRGAIKDTATEALDTVLDHHLTEAAKDKLLDHYDASKRQLWWVMLFLIIAALGGAAFGIALRYPMEQGLADSLRFWSKAVFMGFGAVSVLILFYITMKIVLLRGLLTFILATIIMGYRAAVGILPNIIGYHIHDIASKVVEPIARLADLIEFYALSVLMAVGTVWMFIAVFEIHLNLWTFSLATVAIITLVAIVFRDKKPPVWLRRAAIAMSVVSLVVAASFSISPAFRTVGGIRQDCIAQYYKFGTPKDANQVKLCNANVETEMMSNLVAFAALKGKRLTAAQVDEWNALATVILAALEDKPEPGDKPKPLDWSSGSVASTPNPANTGAPAGTGAGTKKPKPPKPPVATGAPKPAGSALQERIAALRKSGQEVSKLTASVVGQ
jgi:hypothetical protein